MTTWRRFGSLVVSVVAALVAVGAFAGPAHAHSKLISSSPEDGAVLASAPAEVSFTFDEDLLPGVDTIAISDADGKVVSSVKVEPDGNVIAAPWPTGLADGTYQAAYRIVSADGHPVTGAILVTIDSTTTAGSTLSGSPVGAASSPAATGAATTAPALAESGDRDDSGTTVLGLVAGLLVIALVVVGGGLWLARRRRSRERG